MPDMYVPMVWLPSGRVDPDAGLRIIDNLGDDVMVAAAVEGGSISGWEVDLRSDLGVYDGTVPPEDPPQDIAPARVARTFVAAFSRVADSDVAARGLVTRIDVPNGGVVLAAGGEYGGDTPVSVATLHCALVVFPSVAAAMGAIPPHRWAISEHSPEHTA
jgi:hypothetical protein